MYRLDLKHKVITLFASRQRVVYVAWSRPVFAGLKRSRELEHDSQVFAPFVQQSKPIV
jgi:hypothetical protein